MNQQLNDTSAEDIIIEKENYKDKWENYKSRLTICLSIMLGWIPITLIFGGGLSKAFNSIIPMVCVAAAMLTLVAVTACRFIYWRCPRCDKFYMVKPPWISVVHWWTKKCVNCGLPKHSENDPDYE